MTVCWLVVNTPFGSGHASSCRSGRVRVDPGPASRPERVLQGLVILVFTECENKMPTSFRPSDEHGLDRAARTSVSDREGSPIGKTKVGYHVGAVGGYACAATVAGRVN